MTLTVPLLVPRGPEARKSPHIFRPSDHGAGKSKPFFEPDGSLHGSQDRGRGLLWVYLDLLLVWRVGVRLQAREGETRGFGK